MPDNRAELPLGAKPERLRELADLQGAYPIFVEPLRQAADEIERLRAIVQQSEGAVSDTEIEEAANYEAPNRYQTYGLDVHKAFVGGAVFGAYLQRNIPRVRASNPTKQSEDSPPLYVRFGSGLVDENGDSVDFLVDTRPFPESVKYTPAVPGSAEQSEDSACVAELEQVLSDLRQGTIKPYALRAVRDAITEIKRARKRATVEKVDLEDRVAEYLLGVSRDDIRIGNAAATVIKLVTEARSGARGRDPLPAPFGKRGPI